MQARAYAGIGPEALARYVAAARPLHESLQATLTQAAGYSLLVLTRGRRLALLDAPVVAALEALSGATDGIAALRVPDDARHHHHHLTAGAAALRQALHALEQCLRPAADEGTRDRLTRGLRAATDHLRATTRLLPGFAMVDLGQSCCAVHARSAGLLCQRVIETGALADG